ncbi:hypothetical protein LTR29_014942 [Friedmanniomyces endolithicus]|nr:hypothetical protein LTR29_014942 [Friedmanniomyces endolithicus]
MVEKMVDMNATGKPHQPASLEDPRVVSGLESRSFERTSNAVEPTVTLQGSLPNGGYATGPSTTTTASATPDAVNHNGHSYSSSSEASHAYLSYDARNAENIYGYTYPLSNSYQHPHHYDHSPGVPHMALQTTHQPVPQFNTAAQMQAGSQYNLAPSTGLAALWTIDKLKIVHTTEANHGQVLRHYKLGHYTKTTKNAKDEPKLKSKVPQAGGKTADVWRCAKAHCSYCNLVARGYTDLTEALAFSHNITGVATAKKSYKEKGKTTTPTPQTIAATNGGLAHTPHLANHQQNLTATNGGIAPTSRHADYYGTMQAIASSGYFARPAAPSLQQSNATPMHATSPANIYSQDQDMSTTAPPPAPTAPIKQARYSITNSRQMMTETTTEGEDTRRRQAFDQHKPEQQRVTVTNHGDGTIAPYLLVLTPDSSDTMSWEGGDDSVEDMDTDAEGSDADADSSYPIEYMEANVRALIAESQPMHVTRVPGYDY